MAIPITFISAADGKRLAKRVTPKTTVAAPNVKLLNSETHYISPDLNGLKELYDLLVYASSQGKAMHKGPLRKKLENESRAGQTDTTALTQLLILDIDGWPMHEKVERPLTKEKLRLIADRVVTRIPELGHVSYIAHASSSIGLKSDVIEAKVHLFFLLNETLFPSAIKEYLKHLNLSLEAFSAHLKLSTNMTSLRWIIDPVMADNARILYIAPPILENIESPFSDDDDRWVLIERETAVANITPAIAEIVPQINEAKATDKITALRRDVGLKRHTPKYRAMRNADGAIVQVLSNPESISLVYVRHTDRWVIFNINTTDRAGDSNAYYCPIDNPDIVYNFKSEPPFEMAIAAPATYEWFHEKFAEQIKNSGREYPLVFRDFQTDKHYQVLVDYNKDEVVRARPIAPANIKDWLDDMGHSTPDPIPTWDFIFDPQNDRVIDKHNRRLNKYQRTELMKNLLPILDKHKIHYSDLPAGVDDLCPTIALLIRHVCGGGEQEFAHFLHWLAVVLQTRDRTDTAWIFSGVQGTGKGMLFEKVLKPIIGDQYAVTKRVDHLEDQFNEYSETALIQVYDEFKLSHSKSADKMLDIIKDMITNPVKTIRRMQVSGYQVKNHTNYLFFSNHTDVIRIEQGDRRLNVTPPQMLPLRLAHPELMETLAEQLTAEVPAFASYLMHMQVSVEVVRAPLNNEAKDNMRRASIAWHEQFCMAIREGNLDFFIEEFFDAVDTGVISSRPLEEMNRDAVKKIILRWMRDSLTQARSIVPADHIQVVFETMGGQLTTRKKFARLLSCNDLPTIRKSYDDTGAKTNCVITDWKSLNYDLREMLEQENVRIPEILNQEERPCATTH